MEPVNEQLNDFEIYVFGSKDEFVVGVDNVVLNTTQVNQSLTTQSKPYYWFKEKIAGWNDPVPQTRSKCVKWARTDFPPIKTCVGWKTEKRFYRNDVWLTVSSPTASDLKKAVERALSDAAVVAAIIAIGTGGAGAIPAFKAVFKARLLQEVEDAVVDVSTSGGWGKWH